MMSEIQIAVTSDIGATPDVVYAVLADYRVGHPAILPKAFTRLTVLEGGQGAGTVVEAEMSVMGNRQILHLTVSEPEPGRVLAEEDSAAGIRTTFTVEPLHGGASSRVTIASHMRVPSGLSGAVQAAIIRRFTHRLYRDELALLDRVVQGQAQNRD